MSFKTKDKAYGSDTVVGWLTFLKVEGSILAGTVMENACLLIWFPVTSKIFSDVNNNWSKKNLHLDEKSCVFVAVSVHLSLSFWPL